MSPSSLHLLTDLVDLGRESGSTQSARRLLAQVAVQKDVLPVIVKLLEEKGAQALARQNLSLDPPLPLDPDHIACDPIGASQSFQERLADEPAPVREQALALVRRSFLERSEFASLSAQAGDFFLDPTPILTSHHAKEIDSDLAYIDRAMEDICNRMARALKADPGLADRPLILRILHTHPLGFGNHGDGRYYTHLSLGDLRFADQRSSVFRDRLRAAGFTGRIEIRMSALPVPFRPLGESLAERLWIATYRREIP
jgi:hypothetical protein